MMRILLAFFCTFLVTTPLWAAPKEFSEFRLDLPDGWNASERTAFSSNDRNEYMLVAGKTDAQEERYLAHITIFLLPNKPGKNARESALILAERQGDASEPKEQGPFWVFTGDPRDNVLKGRATTYVAANATDLLIIIVKDPDNIGAATIFQSIEPTTERSRKLLQKAP